MLYCSRSGNTVGVRSSLGETASADSLFKFRLMTLYCRCWRGTRGKHCSYYPLRIDHYLHYNDGHRRWRASWIHNIDDWASWANDLYIHDDGSEWLQDCRYGCLH